MDPFIIPIAPPPPFEYDFAPARFTNNIFGISFIQSKSGKVAEINPRRRELARAYAERDTKDNLRQYVARKTHILPKMLQLSRLEKAFGPTSTPYVTGKMKDYYDVGKDLADKFKLEMKRYVELGYPFDEAQKLADKYLEKEKERLLQIHQKKWPGITNQIGGPPAGRNPFPIHGRGLRGGGRRRSEGPPPDDSDDSDDPYGGGRGGGSRGRSTTRRRLDELDDDFDIRKIHRDRSPPAFGRPPPVPDTNPPPRSFEKPRLLKNTRELLQNQSGKKLVRTPTQKNIKKTIFERVDEMDSDEDENPFKGLNEMQIQQKLYDQGSFNPLQGATPIGNTLNDLHIMMKDINKNK